MTDTIHDQCLTFYWVDGEIESICLRSNGHDAGGHPGRRKHYSSDTERVWDQGEGAEGCTYSDAAGNKIPWDMPDHIPQLSPVAGARPYCSCGWGNQGRSHLGDPVIADHLRQVRREITGLT
jgi:hypothetical protein